MQIDAPISVGELIDKMTILAIKLERIGDAAKRANVRVEYDLLAALYRTHGLADRVGAALESRLAAVNLELWDVEDRLRDCEAAADFGAGFVALARSVYRLNDERAAVKKAINAAVGSLVVEEKSYGSA